MFQRLIGGLLGAGVGGIAGSYLGQKAQNSLLGDQDYSGVRTRCSRSTD